METSRNTIRLANTAWESLFRAHTTLIRRYQAADVWGDLSMREYDVLYTLASHPTPLRLGELREGVLLSQPALSRLVERLVERGLIVRTEDTADGRAVRLELTDTGRAVQRDVGRRHARSVASEMSALTIDELRELQRLCRKLSGQTASNTAEPHPAQGETP